MWEVAQYKKQNTIPVKSQKNDKITNAILGE
jgi:hypothetical protein